LIKKWLEFNKFEFFFLLYHYARKRGDI
jgi:hypothetical protein